MRQAVADVSISNALGLHVHTDEGPGTIIGAKREAGVLYYDIKLADGRILPCVKATDVVVRPSVSLH